MITSSIKVGDAVTYKPNKVTPDQYPAQFQSHLFGIVTAYFWEGDVGTVKKYVVEVNDNTLTFEAKNLEVYNP